MTNGLFNTRRVGSLLGQVIIRIIAPPKTASNIGLRKRSLHVFNIVIPYLPILIQTSS